MKKNVITRIASLLFALITVFALMSPAILTASAAASDDSRTVSASASISTVPVDTSKNYMMVKNGKTATIRSSTSVVYTKIATVSSGSVLYVSGKSGNNFYKIVFNINNKNVTYYIKASELTSAPKTTNAKLLYTTIDSAALRQAPSSDGTKTNLAKGTVLLKMADITNSAGNKWFGAIHSGQYAYIFSDRVASCQKITVSLTANAVMKTKASTYDLKLSVSPKAISGFTFSSNDSSIATVNKSGKVTLKGGAGKVSFTAQIPGIIKTSVSSDVIMDIATYKQTTNYTCGAASILTVANSFGKLTNKKDTQIYNAACPESYIVSTLNKQLGANYVNKKLGECGLEAYENALRSSLKKGYPAILLIAFPKKHFAYATNPGSGHYVTLIGIVDGEDGITYAIVADSFANRFKSTEYSDNTTGYVTLPLSVLYEYGKTKKSVVINP